MKEIIKHTIKRIISSPDFSICSVLKLLVGIPSRNDFQTELNCNVKVINLSVVVEERMRLMDDMQQQGLSLA
jgi:hypothetical protein